MTHHTPAQQGASACPICGASNVTERDGRLYVEDTIGTLHGCTAPDAELPDAAGEAIFLTATQITPARGLISSMRGTE